MTVLPTTILLLSASLARACIPSSPIQTPLDNLFYSKTWLSTGEVPNKLAQVPPAPLYITYNGGQVWPNNTVTTENMVSRPILDWSAQAGSLYTIVLIDFGIERLGGLQYYHWLVSNVPNGDSVVLGDEVKDYIPPYYFLVGADGTLDPAPTGGHDILALVYRQRGGRVDMSAETQTTCDDTIVNGRIGDHVALAETYNLELVAGNFFFTTYTEATNTLLCYTTKCSGAPFPVPAPGINDGPECSQEARSFAGNVNQASA